MVLDLYNPLKLDHDRGKAVFVVPLGQLPEEESLRIKNHDSVVALDTFAALDQQELFRDSSWITS